MKNKKIKSIFFSILAVTVIAALLLYFLSEQKGFNILGASTENFGSSVSSNDATSTQENSGAAIITENMLYKAGKTVNSNNLDWTVEEAITNPDDIPAVDGISVDSGKMLYIKLRLKNTGTSKISVNTQKIEVCGLFSVRKLVNFRTPIFSSNGNLTLEPAEEKSIDLYYELKYVDELIFLIPGFETEVGISPNLKLIYAAEDSREINNFNDFLPQTVDSEQFTSSGTVEVDGVLYSCSSRITLTDLKDYPLASEQKLYYDEHFPYIDTYMKVTITATNTNADEMNISANGFKPYMFVENSIGFSSEVLDYSLATKVLSAKDYFFFNMQPNEKKSFDIIFALPSCYMANDVKYAIKINPNGSANSDVKYIVIK